MDVKHVLLVSCSIIVANCQPTISNAVDAVCDFQTCADMTAGAESISQLLSKLQFEVKSEIAEIRQIVTQQHRNETQSIQELKKKTEDIRHIVFEQHGNETRGTQEMKSKMEEIRQIMRENHMNNTQATHDLKSKTEKMLEIVIQQQNRYRKGCPTGFDYLPEGGSCYMVMSERLIWDNATEKCRQMIPGAHLAAITSQEENNAIVRYLRSLLSRDNIRCEKIWLSGQTRNASRCGDPYVWKPLRGFEIPFSYTNWNPADPDCYDKKEHCVEITPARNYSWNDYLCHSENCAICELHV